LLTGDWKRLIEAKSYLRDAMDRKIEKLHSTYETFDEF